jgi:hypothetical protein
MLQASAVQFLTVLDATLLLLSRRLQLSIICCRVGPVRLCLSCMVALHLGCSRGSRVMATVGSSY